MMMIILFALVAGGVILAVAAYFNISANDAKSYSTTKREHYDYYYEIIERLSEQVQQLQLQIRQISEVCENNQAQLSQLIEKSLSLPDAALLKEQLNDAHSQIDSLKQDNLRLGKQVEKLNLLAKENEHLNNQVVKLNLDVKDLENEKLRQAKVIDGLNAKKKDLQTQLKKTKAEFDETSKELAQTKKSESDLQKSLSKHKTMLSNSEKEVEQLRTKNEELRDGLIYEINN